MGTTVTLETFSPSTLAVLSRMPKWPWLLHQMVRWPSAVHQAVPFWGSM